MAVNDAKRNVTPRAGPSTPRVRDEIGVTCELPRPARAAALAAGGASCFSVALLYVKRTHRKRRLHRRGFGVTHSYWLNGGVPRADARFLSRSNDSRPSHSRTERTASGGAVSESGAEARNLHRTIRFACRGGKGLPYCERTRRRALYPRPTRSLPSLVEEGGVAPCTGQAKLPSFPKQ